MKKESTMRRNCPQVLSCLTVLLIFLFSICSCKYFSMEPLTVTKVNPDTEYADTQTLKKVDVYFSADVDKTLTESAFSLLEDGVPMEGRYGWPEDNHLSYSVIEQFNETSIYTIKVTTMAEDTDGNSLKDDYTHTFRSSGDSQRPSIVSITPATNERIAQVRPTIEVTFSEPMDVTSFLNGFHLYPSAEGYFAESVNNTVFRYVLTEDLDWQMNYTITVSDTVMDTVGNNLGKEGKQSFYVGDETTAPSIVSVTDESSGAVLTIDDLLTQEETVNAGVEKNSRITIQFSEEMDRSIVPNCLNFVPSITYNTEWNAAGTALTIKPIESFNRDTIYSLTIGKACTDVQGNEMSSASVYKIRANGPHSIPPKISRVEFANSFSGANLSDTIELTPLGSFAYEGAYNTAGGCTGFFDIYMELAEGATFDIFDFIDAFSVTVTAASITPNGCQLDDNIAFLASEIPVRSGLPANTHVIRYIVAVDNSGTGKYSVAGNIRMTLNSTFKDSYDNKCEETWSLRVNTTN